MRYRAAAILPFYLLLFLSTATIAEPSLKGTPQELQTLLLEQRKLVHISGYGEVKTNADRAVVSLMVKTNDSQLRTALEQNQRIREAIRKKLLAKGMSDSAIQFSRFSNTPNYGFFGDKPSSYDISNEVKITISRESSLNEIAGIVDSQDEVYFVGSNIEHSLQEQSKQQALAKALKNAMAKKDLYEVQLGLKLQAIKVSEQVAGPAPIVLREKVRKQAYASSMGVTEAQHQFGEMTYRATVDVEFFSQ
jgi:uncharacterized protein YggE